MVSIDDSPGQTPGPRNYPLNARADRTRRARSRITPTTRSPAPNISQVGGSGTVVTVAEKASDQIFGLPGAELESKPLNGSSSAPTANVPRVRSSAKGGGL